MTPLVVSGLGFLQSRRKAMDVFPPRMRALWNEWELRVIVLVSLTLQLLLIMLGSTRKYTRRIWIRAFIWSAYLMADAVAVLAIGVIVNNLGDIQQGDHPPSDLDPKDQLTAFWAPFLLLHLGGPDTITAYSLEDNELWLRHFLALVVQTGFSVYVLLMAWTGSRISLLTIPILMAGLIKYGERVWALRSASQDIFAEACPEPSPYFSKLMEESRLKQYEGYKVMEIETTEVLQEEYDGNPVAKAYSLMQTFKRIFVDLTLSVRDRDISISVFNGLEYMEAFEVIEVELGLIYDLFYTKAMVAYTRRGLIGRLFSFSFTCFVLVMFSLSDKHDYRKFDLVVTLLLLGVAIFLEVFAMIVLLFSDWTYVWLSKHNTSRILSLLQKRVKQYRWSGSVSQYSLLSLSLNEKPTFCIKFQKLLHLHRVLERQRYKTSVDLTDELKELIFNHLKEKFKQLEDGWDGEKDFRSVYSCKGERVLKKFGQLDQLMWSTELEFDQSILIWYVATELCYYSDAKENKNPSTMSRSLSQYMIYLLVIHPAMLPIQIGQGSFRDALAELEKFFGGKKSEIWPQGVEVASSRPSSHSKLLDNMTHCEKAACGKLIEVHTDIQPFQIRGDRSKSVLFDACRLARLLNNMEDSTKKWDMINNVWVETLAFAANQCRGNRHTQQLRRGGELLTHVWLLMVHFGLTGHFQIPHGRQIATLVLR